MDNARRPLRGRAGRPSASARAMSVSRFTPPITKPRRRRFVRCDGRGGLRPSIARPGWVDVGRAPSGEGRNRRHRRVFVIGCRVSGGQGGPWGGISHVSNKCPLPVFYLTREGVGRFRARRAAAPCAQGSAGHNRKARKGVENNSAAPPGDSSSSSAAAERWSLASAGGC